MSCELIGFIESNPDPRELKRALAVQMVQQQYLYEEIQAVLQVSIGFISKWKQQFESAGVAGLRLGYRGASPYLTADQRTAVLDWLKQQSYWHLPELETHIASTYGVVYKAKKSYYALFRAAGLSWKKSQACNPKRDPALVAQKNGDYRMAWIAAGRD